MNTIVKDPQSLSDGSLGERSRILYRSLSAISTTPNQNGLSPASKDWLSFLFMTLGNAISCNVLFFLYTENFCQLIRLVPASLFHYRILES